MFVRLMIVLGILVLAWIAVMSWRTPGSVAPQGTSKPIGLSTTGHGGDQPAARTNPAQLPAAVPAPSQEGELKTK
jgi:hypothetical protein